MSRIFYNRRTHTYDDWWASITKKQVCKCNRSYNGNGINYLSVFFLSIFLRDYVNRGMYIFFFFKLNATLLRELRTRTFRQIHIHRIITTAIE